MRNPWSLKTATFRKPLTDKEVSEYTEKINKHLLYGEIRRRWGKFYFIGKKRDEREETKR